MMLSIVTTLYKSAPYIQEFYERVSEAARKIAGKDYEIIFVNDGSPDNSLEVATELTKTDSHIKVVDLSRNFGHHKAIMAGLAQTQGDNIFLIDSDLEEQPEWLLLFHKTLEAEQCDVVYGVQKNRIASKFSNFLGSVFWKALNCMSTIKIPQNPMTCRLMSRQYVDALLTVKDQVLYLAGTFAWVGFRQVGLPLTKQHSTKKEQSTYTIVHKVTQLIDSFASFNSSPLIFTFIIGLTVCGFSLLFALYLFISKLITPTLVISGFTSLMISIWFLGGLILASIGTLGLYLSKVFQEVKDRPNIIVRKIYRGSNE